MSRRALFLIAITLAAGLLAYGVTRVALKPSAIEAKTAGDHLDWLAREFDLDASARAAVARLQTDYEPICENHCAAIARARAALDEAANPAARAAAEAELFRLKQLCAESTRAHIRAVAAQMTPPQAARFLALMEPKVAHNDERSGAPALAPSGAR